MTLTIDLTAEEEAGLAAAARRQGTDIEQCVRRLIAQGAPSAPEADVTPGAATRALFAQWDEEDATDDPNEIAARNEEWEELKHNMNANRRAVGARILFP